MREALRGMRETLGDRHAHTLAFIYLLAALLKKFGKFEEAEQLVLGTRHARRSRLRDLIV